MVVGVVVVVVVVVVSGDTSSAAQGGDGSFRIGNLSKSLVVVNHGWQRESTDGLTVKVVSVVFLEWLPWLQSLPGRSHHRQLLNVVWRSAAVVVVVV